MKPFIDLGTRNKGTFWEYGAAYSFANTKLPVTAYKIPSFLGFGQGEQNRHCHHIDVINDTKELLIREFKEGKYTKQFFIELHRLYREPMEETKKLCERNFSNAETSELITSFDKVFINMFESHKPMLLALKSQYLNDLFHGELMKVLASEEKEGSKIAEFASLLLSPSKLTFPQQEEELIVEMLKKIGTNLKTKNKKEFDDVYEMNKIKEGINLLASNYGWFHMEYMKEPLTEEDYKKILWQRINAEGMGNWILPSENLKKIKEQRENFFNSHRTSESLRNLAFALQEFSFILDASKAAVIEASFLSYNLFSEIAKRIGLTRNEMLYLTYPEIKELLQKGKKADMGLINKRKEYRVVLLKDKDIKVYEGEEALRLGSSLVRESEETGEIKGIVGFPGVVRGKVQVIHSIGEKEKFIPGSILVTHDGTAELTIFLKQASAIITDQGGMICHAAIIAREMRTPCIVGTGNASKILKDGDFVEVDAEKGIVKKLN